MGKLFRSRLRKEKISAENREVKQSTLDDISYQFDIQKPSSATKPEKTIAINDILRETKEDEMALQVEFSLLPSKSSFSKINLDLYFDNQLLRATALGMPQSPLLTDSFSFPMVLDMRGIAEGKHIVRTEMYEPWAVEKLNFASSEIIVDFVPFDRKTRLVKIPIIKSIAGSDLKIISEEKNLYNEIKEDNRRELRFQRDSW